MYIDIIDKILSNQGHTNSFAGIIVVFVGLILISVSISLFNKVSHTLRNRKAAQESLPARAKESEKKVRPKVKDIPEDELVAIATAVEVYRKLHFEILQNEITFTHGSAQTPWKMIQKTRKSITRAR
jgi:hypothetical protein